MAPRRRAPLAVRRAGRIALDPVRLRERVLSHRNRGRTAARRPAAALAREHARSAARGRLLDARPEHRSRGLDGRGHGGGELARAHTPGPAARGARGRRAAAESHRRRRHRGVRVRFSAASEALESSRRGVARRDRGGASRSARGGARARADAVRAVRPDRHARVSGRLRALGGSSAQLSRGRQAERAARDFGPVSRTARGGAPGLAAARARDRPRAQQLARADQVDGGHACAS